MSSTSENGSFVQAKEQSISTALTDLDINKQDVQNSNDEAKDSVDLKNGREIIYFSSSTLVILPLYYWTYHYLPTDTYLI